MSKIAVVVACAIVLAGCASMGPRKWYRDGATEEDFNMDKGQCQAQGFSIGGGTMMQAAMVYNSCMRGKGWVQR